jgi:Flp pilus assembly protein TadG
MKLHFRTSKSEKGQSLVELGVSITILLLILVGVIELGMLLFQYIAMRDAAQEGAVYTTIYPTACNQTIERVKKDLYNIDPSQVDVTVEVNGVLCHLATPADACASKEVRVTVHQPNYQISMPFLGSVLGRQSLDIKASITGTIIRPPCP